MNATRHAHHDRLHDADGFRLPEMAWLAAVLLIASPVLVTGLGYQFAGTPADETEIALFGMRTANGDVPYRDFFTMLPPGAPVLAALPAVLGGPGLAPLRIMMLVLMGMTTAAIYGIVRAGGAGAAWAAVCALWVPCVLFPFWSVANHYWFAIAFIAPGFALLGSGCRRGRALAGMLIGLGALCNQIVGGIAFLVFAGVLRQQRDEHRSCRLSLAMFFVPAGSAFVWLSATHAIDDAIRDVLIWPLHHYKQPGGYNSAENAWLLSVPGTRLSPVLPMGDELTGSVLVLMILVPFAAVLLELVTSRGRNHGARLDLAVLAAAMAGFLAGRQDIQHMVLWAPAALHVLGRRTTVSTPSLCRILARAVLAVGLVIGLTRFALLWTAEPPDLKRIATVDREMAGFIRTSILARMPGVVDDSLPVVVLSPAASAVYLYWSPAAPPRIDWVLPPSGGFTTTAHYEHLREYIERGEVPYLIVPDDALQEFRTVVTPLQELLSSDYRVTDRTQYGLVLRRNAR